MKRYYDGKDFALYHGDCRSVIRSLPDNCVDAIVCDPPYELGFMGKRWDANGVAFDITMWNACLHVLKPGGHLIAFGGTRTYHRLACAVEDAAFEVRDCLMWIFGTGFPKSLNFEDGIGTALKPSYEPVILARKPVDGTLAQNLEKWGTGGLNIRETRIKGRWPANVLFDTEAAMQLDAMSGYSKSHDKEITRVRQKEETGPDPFKNQTYRKLQAYGDEGGASRFFYTAKADREEREFGLAELQALDSKGTVNRKPNSAGVQSPRAGAGRGAATPIYRCARCGLNLQGGRAATKCPDGAAHEPQEIGTGVRRRNDHPTVKPIDLMEWLCRLVTPARGIILDPFVGSGSTGIAALNGGFRFIGIDLDAHYLDIAKYRIEHRTKSKLRTAPDGVVHKKNCRYPAMQCICGALQGVSK